MKIFKYTLFFIPIFFFISANISAAHLSIVKNISFSNKNDHEILTIILKNTPEINIFELENPKRLVIDLENSRIPQIITKKYVKGNIVKLIRTNQFKKNSARIVLDLKDNNKFLFNLKTQNKKNFTFLKIYIFKDKFNFSDETDSNKPKKIKIKAAEVKTQPSDLKFENKFEQKNKTNDFDVETNGEEIIFAFEDSLSKNIFNDSPTPKKPELSISGTIKTKASHDTEKLKNKIENKSSLRNKTIIEAEYKKTLTFSVLSDYLYFGDNETFNEYDFDIYELTYQYINSKISFSLGKQIIRWGKTDQLSPVDTLNPEDMREFVTNDYEDRKIPLWMADLKLFSDIFNIEFVYIPFFEKAKYNNFETDWSRFPHLKKEIRQNTFSNPLKQYFDNILISENKPHNENEYGIRLFKTIKSFDFGFTWHRFTEDEPYISNFPIKNLNINGDFSVENSSSSINLSDITNDKIEMNYKKTSAFGFEFETIVSGFGVRGEALYQNKKSFLKEDVTSIRMPVFTYVLGVDYSAQSNIYMNFQFSHDHISSFSKKILYYEKNTYLTFGELSKYSDKYWTKLSLEYLYNLNDKSSLISPKICYTYFKNIEIIIGADFFNGNNNSSLGRFKNNSQFFLELNLSF
ncbi:MAG: AMIN domain-containing protein [Desulforegulaceae bacterium]|nr:AMIN domain-containing protein [Desulforegulaceae bacterium]